jgi:TfoX-like protein
MARDQGLEAIVNDELTGVKGITQKAMFGGHAWLVHGNLLCGARHDGLLVRLGRDQDEWALKTAGITPMITRGRIMNGWVRASAEAYGDDGLRRKLLNAALEFNRSLPNK